MEFDVIGDITGAKRLLRALEFANLAVYVSAMAVDGGVSARVLRKFVFHPAIQYRPSYTGMRLLVSESAK